MLNKRGEFTLLQVITIIGGIAAAFVLVSIILRASSKENSEYYFYAKDSAMLVDAMLSAPQGVTISYPSKPGFARIKSSSVGFYASGGDGAPVQEISFIPRKDITILESGADSKIFFLLKNQKFLTLASSPEALKNYGKAP